MGESALRDRTDQRLDPETDGAGSFELAGIRRTMMFGDESEQSTGATSTKVVGTAFRTLAAWAEGGHSALLVLDEPKMGLSDGYAAAMGAYLARNALAMPARACGLVVITHNRPLVRALEAGLGERPTFVKLGPLASYEEWLAGEVVRSVEELLALPEVGLARWRTLNKILEELRNEKK